MRNRLAIVFYLMLAAMPAACNSRPDLRQEVDAYLKEYERTYQKLSYESSLAEWESNTKIVDGDTTNIERTKRANEAYAKFAGSAENIDRIKRFLTERDKLTPIQVRQLEVMLYSAGNS